MAIDPNVSPAGGALPSGVTIIGGIVLDLVGVNGQRLVAQLAASDLYEGTVTTSQQLIGTQTGLTPTFINTLGGGLSRVAVRVTLFDGDNAPSDFDFNQNRLLLNGFDIGNWSDVETITTDGLGNPISSPRPNFGFANEELDTGWFFAQDPTFLANFYNSLVSGQRVDYTFVDNTVAENFLDFKQGLDGSLIGGGGGGPIIDPGGGGNGGGGNGGGGNGGGGNGGGNGGGGNGGGNGGGPGGPGTLPGDVIVGDGQTGNSAIPLRCRNGTPVPFLTPRGQRRLQPMTLTSGPNTLTVELVSTQPGQPRSWRAAAAGSPARARKFNRAGYRPGGGFEMFGGGGNDVLQVRQRQNILRGQQGNDILTGGPRRDFLLGGRGDDVINGGGGKNTIVGGAGNDTLIGGPDRDMFVYRRVNHGTDLIQNYQPGVDVIDLRRIFARAPFQVAGRSNYQRLNTFVRLIEREGNTLVQIDRNGKQAGKSFNTLAVLEGIAVSQLSSCDFVV
ncbi:hypothetical protein [Thermoleptolyngbya sp. C42_A2020_037]|uniref:hypothetical protein n=1 Tax=Thermoleptolyngbya sp. C42_A2020_037 TaxID=2747799 RepID=UPI0019FB97A5|nr:hypothetical protein [Thermoleptolyngbya sp. C42_A2020_037]MBF2086223.1 hypothetical protein [Thermoleptolyngbya sp. C42_A2020_037]